MALTTAWMHRAALVSVDTVLCSYALYYDPESKYIRVKIHTSNTLNKRQIKMKQNL
jgi:hypothetical protein